MLGNAFKHLQKADQLVLRRPVECAQYQLGLFQQTLKKQGITQSMSRKGRYLDNAVMEIWSGMMKAEFFYQKKLADAQSFKAELKEYVHYYNHDRIKQELKGLSSVQH